MATASRTAFTDIQTATETAKTGLATLWAAYTQAKSLVAKTASEQKSLEQTYAENELVLRDLQRQEDTLNQQYLDQRNDPAPTTFFARIGLGATQDWVLAFFFFGYGLMAFAILVAVMRMSTQPLRVAMFGALVAILIGFVISLLIRFLG